ncbi:hypothetical protein PbB2_02614 [Candidatus Phycosocius bacilliformis]|uniref:Uncharacterized protein n=1 Tax=Candidatus Phycosocius bacilliformis TaxID=1445552 RepID=A0A2P2ED03_9PROT|nr:SIR2 family protein [Candidatus Phycosocius bacilliformis]GBF58924.1 hypothetical protein PbB2_02614 [Candidatus Phycosocius bacilliformis]
MVDIITLENEYDPVATDLQAYFQSGNINFLIGSGASMPAIQVAGNIEAEINELIEAGDEPEANLISLNFIEAIEATCMSIKSHDLLGSPVDETFRNYKRLLEIVDRILFERKSNLLPRQANIFTTNYDTFIEHAAADLPTLILNDGFDRSSAIDGTFSFAPELYFDRTYRSGTVYNRPTEVPTINLLKIHGSLTWQSTDAGICYNRKSITALTDPEKAVPETVSESLNKRALILPNVGKFHSTLLDRTYYDLLRMFANAIDRENALLVAFGFSFADEHIFDITKRALRNPTAQLLIFAFNSAAVTGFQVKFAQHRNVKIIAPTAAQVINFECFNTLLESIPPVLKS